MHRSLKKRIVGNGLRTLALTGLASITAITAASAQQASSTRANQYYSVYDQNPAVAGAASRQDRADFDRSGTRGRMGLGASPYHPEGPGNASD